MTVKDRMVKVESLKKITKKKSHQVTISHALSHVKIIIFSKNFT